MQEHTFLPKLRAGAVCLTSTGLALSGRTKSASGKPCRRLNDAPNEQKSREEQGGGGMGKRWKCGILVKLTKTHTRFHVAVTRRPPAFTPSHNLLAHSFSVRLSSGTLKAEVGNAPSTVKIQKNVLELFSFQQMNSPFFHSIPPTFSLSAAHLNFKWLWQSAVQEPSQLRIYLSLFTNTSCRFFPLRVLNCLKLSTRLKSLFTP